MSRKVYQMDQAAMNAIAGTSRYAQGMKGEILHGEVHGRDPMQADLGRKTPEQKMAEAAKQTLAWQRAQERAAGIPDPTHRLALPKESYYDHESYSPISDIIAANAHRQGQSLPGLHPTIARAQLQEDADEGVPIRRSSRAPAPGPMRRPFQEAQGTPAPTYSAGARVAVGDVVKDHSGLLAKITESAGAGRFVIDTVSMGRIQVGADYLKKCVLLRRT